MVYVGTAGYSYKDWVGPFYPEGTKDSSMLEHYVQHFKFVEVNSSYYHMPGQRLFNSINNKTSEDFKVAVKLFKGFTHERDAGKEEAGKFMNSLAPVIDSEKLVCLLAQFPYSFHCNTENMDHLKRVREWFGDVDVSVEFRNQGWIRSEVIELLRKEDLGYVCVDEPSIKGLIKTVVASTSKVSYLRLHGRNANKWYAGENSERYNYLYSSEELGEWVPRVKELEANSQITLVSFNNHPFGKAVENARVMEEYLQKVEMWNKHV